MEQNSPSSLRQDYQRLEGVLFALPGARWFHCSIHSTFSLQVEVGKSCCYYLCCACPLLHCLCMAYEWHVLRSSSSSPPSLLDRASKHS